MDNKCLTIQKHIEAVYDIPFVVKDGFEYNDPYYMIIPENEMEELFAIKILFRQNIRMIIDVQPQKYAAEMLKDMQLADSQKKQIFCEYIHMFRDKHMKVDLKINNILHDIDDKTIWEEQWKQFQIRATKILTEGENNDLQTVIFWTEQSVGMVLSLLKIEQLESEELQYAEGKVSQVLINKYERNPVNRQLCLATNGYCCKICGFDFENTYGEIGKQFIHVHHIEKVSSFGGEYYLNPKTDLIPVCPNCHAMLHRMDPPMMPDELRELIRINREKQGDCK